MSETSKKTTGNEDKKGVTTPSRQGLYAAAAAYSIKAIEILADMMINSKNPNVKLGAAKALLDKALPDLKATELSNPEGKPILIRLDIPNGGNSIQPTG